ncbi:hypothetical protein [Leptolyngbya sp. FACHB-261]|uniref:hypothetical protein n=1 Tax=Leptolyngbya sp. FACHB-261 TaxID=2692806 RepID=UPI001683C648|nr:hypothetical protein [Leptolyngbya sp. FACHB-261]MBD2100881.1 hypothetical protein [Leptolyngbya sp. FACHB-261]
MAGIIISTLLAFFLILLAYAVSLLIPFLSWCLVLLAIISWVLVFDWMNQERR